MRPAPINDISALPARAVGGNLDQQIRELRHALAELQPGIISVIFWGRSAERGARKMSEFKERLRERNAKVMRLRRDRLTYAEIGRRVGLSRDRARCVVVAGEREATLMPANPTLPDGALIESLSLPPKIKLLMRNNRVVTVGEARRLPDKFYLEQPNFGRRSLVIMRAAIGYTEGEP